MFGKWTEENRLGTKHSSRGKNSGDLRKRIGYWSFATGILVASSPKRENAQSLLQLHHLQKRVPPSWLLLLATYCRVWRFWKKELWRGRFIFRKTHVHSSIDHWDGVLQVLVSS